MWELDDEDMSCASGKSRDITVQEEKGRNRSPWTMANPMRE